MANVDSFKSFVKKNPNLITFVRSGDMSWQKFYELYDLYGEENEVWDSYLKKGVKEEKSSNSNNKTSNSLSFSNLIEMAKNIDTDKLQDGISSIQKAIGLFSDMVSKNGNSSPSGGYEPRPIYRKFDD